MAVAAAAAAAIAKGAEAAAAGGTAAAAGAGGAGALGAGAGALGAGELAAAAAPEVLGAAAPALGAGDLALAGVAPEMAGLPEVAGAAPTSGIPFADAGAPIADLTTFTSTPWAEGATPTSTSSSFWSNISDLMPSKATLEKTFLAGSVGQMAKGMLGGKPAQGQAPSGPSIPSRGGGGYRPVADSALQQLANAMAVRRQASGGHRFA